MTILGVSTCDAEHRARPGPTQVGRPVLYRANAPYSPAAGDQTAYSSIQPRTSSRFCGVVLGKNAVVELVGERWLVNHDDSCSQRILSTLRGSVCSKPWQGLRWNARNVWLPGAVWQFLCPHHGTVARWRRPTTPGGTVCDVHVAPTAATVRRESEQVRSTYPTLRRKT